MGNKLESRESTSVAIVKCENYKEENINKALDEAMNYIGGLGNFVGPGMKVLLKVNLLTAKPPEKAVTTHPALVKVLCEKIIKLGATPWVGDSSGGILPEQNPTTKALKVSKIEEVGAKAGARIINFDRTKAVKVDNPNNQLFPHFYIANPVFEADLVICLPKFKTHGLTMFTGSVKNMFGCVPGSLKRDYHCKAPRVKDFSRMLVDVYNITSPVLTIMDGIVGMEEDGPSSGSPRELQLLLAGTDGVALDEIAAGIIGFPSVSLPTSKAAASIGLGTVEREKIKIPGELKDWKVRYFQPPKNSMVIANYLPGFLVSAMMNQLKTLPAVNQNQCTGCEICKDSCPVKAVEIKTAKASIKEEKCIECLCCHELCPLGAISLAPKGLLSRLAFIFLNLKRRFLK